MSAATSFPVQYNKAIVGRNAFAHEFGIHQDGMLKHTQTYEIMTPESVGVKQTSLVMGKHSGRHAFVHKLEELGYKLADNQLEDAFVRFKALADRKKQIYDEDIEALVDEEIAHAQDRVKLVSLSVIAGTRGPQRATMKLDIEGRTAIEECEGNGPVDAIFNCIKSLVPHEATLELYQVHAVTEGTDAQAEVSVRLADKGRSVTARGADPDTLVASAKAYLGALNKLMVRRQRGGVAVGEGSRAFDRRRLIDRTSFRESQMPRSNMSAAFFVGAPQLRHIDKCAFRNCAATFELNLCHDQTLTCCRARAAFYCGHRKPTRHLEVAHDEDNRCRNDRTHARGRRSCVRATRHRRAMRRAGGRAPRMSPHSPMRASPGSRPD